LKLIPKVEAEGEVARAIVEALAAAEGEVTISELTRSQGPQGQGVEEGRGREGQVATLEGLGEPEAIRQ